MKRTHATITVTSLRDPTGKLILAARIAAAKSDMSMNQWLLRLIEGAVTKPTEAQERRRGI